MVCVHGITDTWRTWELILPLLEPHHDTLAITLLGHSGGRAPEPGGEVTLKSLVDEAERDMDAAGFETAHLVGNSLGGWVVLELAARGRARSVTALSPAGGWDVGNRRAMRSYWELVSTQWALRHFEDARAEAGGASPLPLAGPRQPGLPSAERPRRARRRPRPGRGRLPRRSAAADRVAAERLPRPGPDRLPDPDRLGNEGPPAADRTALGAASPDPARRRMGRHPGRRAPAADRPPS